MKNMSRCRIGCFVKPANDALVSECFSEFSAGLAAKLVETILIRLIGLQQFVSLRQWTLGSVI